MKNVFLLTSKIDVGGHVPFSTHGYYNPGVKRNILSLLVKVYKRLSKAQWCIIIDDWRIITVINTDH